MTQQICCQRRWYRARPTTGGQLRSRPYNRAGRWGIDRLRRDIPVIVTYYCRTGRLYLTAAIALVPERAVPLGVRLNHPDEVDTLGNWVLLAYKRPEDD